MFVRELVDGQDIAQVLLVRERELRVNGEGGEYLRLLLGDRTGAVPAFVKEHVPDLSPLCEAGAAVAVAGRYERRELAVRSLRRAEAHEYDLADLLDGPPRPVRQMEQGLR